MTDKEYGLCAELTLSEASANLKRQTNQSNIFLCQQCVALQSSDIRSNVKYSMIDSVRNDMKVVLG